MAATADPVLLRFRAALDVAHGDRIERVVLFGSRARGDHRPDSDDDVAVFLRNIGGFGEEIGRLVDLADPILVETGAVISPVALPEGSYRDRTGSMAEVRREGIDDARGRRPPRAGQGRSRRDAVDRRSTIGAARGPVGVS